MRGAIDLSALRDRAAAAAPTSPTSGPPATGRPPTEPSPGRSPGAGSGFGQGAGAGLGQGAGSGGVTVVDVTDATFQSEVVERSMTTPVVIDLWAEWCEPCKQLSPVLEKLAVEGGGSWVLAKVDIEANPGIRQLFQVQGIPMVVAVVGGRPVDAFTGVQPESGLRSWIGSLLKASGVEVEAPEDPALIAADDALVSGDLEEAERAYKKILSDRPADEAAQAGLAQVVLLRRVEGVDPQAAIAAAEARPDDLDAQGLAADLDVISGRAERGYARLVELVRRTGGEDRDKARAHLVSLFAVAAVDDPAVAAARRALASALF
jgi:putative thioredoxin